MASGTSVYDPSAFPPFAVTVDLVILTVRPPRLQVRFVVPTRRSVSPGKGRPAKAYVAGQAAVLEPPVQRP